MSQTKYVKSIRIKRIAANNDKDRYRFELWLTPNDNSYPQRVKISSVSISDCEGHHKHSVVFSHGGHTSIRDMGGQEKHNEYRFHDIVISKNEYELLKSSAYFHFCISVGGDKEEHIISINT